MSTIIKYKNQSGITYAYEQTSIWDPEKKQARPKRKYLGRVDEETGEIIQTSRKSPRRRKQNQEPPEMAAGSEIEALYLESQKSLTEAREKISRLEKENDALKKRNKKLEDNADAVLKQMKAIVDSKN